MLSKSNLIRLVGVGVAAFVAVATVAYGVIIRPRLLVARQIRNHANCQTLEGWLRNYHETDGRYPARLPEAIPPGRYSDSFRLDTWGHPYLYESDGTEFILVSYGRDGRPDGSDYQALRGLGDHPEGFNICGRYDADEVMSNRGWHRLCGK